jgi:hypothetical protein
LKIIRNFFFEAFYFLRRKSSWLLGFGEEAGDLWWNAL